MADETKKLTAEELDAAKATGITPERYAALKDVRNIEDWNRLNTKKGEAK